LSAEKNSAGAVFRFFLKNVFFSIGTAVFLRKQLAFVTQISGNLIVQLHDLLAYLLFAFLQFCRGVRRAQLCVGMRTAPQRAAVVVDRILAACAVVTAAVAPWRGTLNSFLGVNDGCQHHHQQNQHQFRCHHTLFSANG